MRLNATMILALLCLPGVAVGQSPGVVSGAVLDPSLDNTVTAREQEIIEGRVTDHRGRPLEGVLVQLPDMRLSPGLPRQPRHQSPVQDALIRLQEPGMPELPHDLTDSDGRYRLSMDPSRQARQLQVIADDYARIGPQEEPPFEVGPNDFVLVPLVTVVATPEIGGQPVTDYVQDFLVAEGEVSEARCLHRIRHRQTTWQGQTNVPLNPIWRTSYPIVAYGQRILMLTRTRAGRLASAEFTIPDEPGRTIDIGPQRLTEGELLEVRVASDDGSPLRDALVVFALADRPEHWTRGQEDVPLLTETQSDGRACLYALPRGDWCVRVIARDHEDAIVPVSLPRAEELSVTLTSRP